MKKYFVLFLLAAVLLTPVLILISAGCYPGTWPWEKMYLSSLGLTVLPDGRPNPVAALFFNSSLILGGIAAGAFFAYRAKYSDWIMLRILLWGAGLTGGAALAGIGLLPYNLFPDPHNWCTWISSAAFAVAIVASAAAVKHSGTTVSENLLWLLHGSFILLIWAVLQYLRRRGMLPSTPTGQIQQKIIIFFFWLYMLWNSLQLCRVKRKKT